MTYWLLVPLLGLIAILQATLVPLINLGGLKLDLPLLIIVSWGLLGTPGDAAIWGFITGLFLDLLSGLPFGTTAFAMTAVGLLLGVTQSALFRSNVILPPISAAIATCV
jgi:rod shape-determining protein MreD